MCFHYCENNLLTCWTTLHDNASFFLGGGGYICSRGGATIFGNIFCSPDCWEVGNFPLGTSMSWPKTSFQSKNNKHGWWRPLPFEVHCRHLWWKVNLLWHLLFISISHLPRRRYCCVTSDFLGSFKPIVPLLQLPQELKRREKHTSQVKQMSPDCVRKWGQRKASLWNWNNVEYIH